jgi:hypothetical protein
MKKDPYILQAMRALKIRDSYEDAIARDDVHEIAEIFRDEEWGRAGPKFIVLRNYGTDVTRGSSKMSRFNVSHIVGYDRSSDDPSLTLFKVLGGEFLVEESPEQIDSILKSLGVMFGGDE